MNEAQHRAWADMGKEALIKATSKSGLIFVIISVDAETLDMNLDTNTTEEKLIAIMKVSLIRKGVRDLLDPEDLGKPMG